MKTNHVNAIKLSHPFLRVGSREGEHVVEYRGVTSQSPAVDLEEGGPCSKDDVPILIV